MASCNGPGFVVRTVPVKDNNGKVIGWDTVYGPCPKCGRGH